MWLKLISLGIKYFFLLLLGFSIALVLAAGVGFVEFAIQIFPFIFSFVCKIAMLLLCLITIAIFLESLR